jgi:hypothetical protein
MPRHSPALILPVLAAVCVLAACGESAVSSTTPDASSTPAPDAGIVAPPDAGPTPVDAGPTPDPVDAGPADAGAVDAGNEINPTALCPEPDMETLYPGFLPQNPYSPTGHPADACVRAKHDVIILLGCPSNTDGTPSGSQIARIDIGLALRDAGLGDTFIVTGAAVHNQWVEADALAAQLLARGVPAERIVVENRAQHTDENIYYSSRIMEARGWESALVVSDDPGQLSMTAVCDSNCCVDLGRLTVLDFPTLSSTARVGHYARLPWGGASSDAECTHIERTTKAMCSKLSSRLSCASDFKLPN